MILNRLFHPLRAPVANFDDNNSIAYGEGMRWCVEFVREETVQSLSASAPSKPCKNSPTCHMNRPAVAAPAQSMFAFEAHSI